MRKESNFVPAIMGLGHIGVDINHIRVTQLLEEMGKDVVVVPPDGGVVEEFGGFLGGGLRRDFSYPIYELEARPHFDYYSPFTEKVGERAPYTKKQCMRRKRRNRMRNKSVRLNRK